MIKTRLAQVFYTDEYAIKTYRLFCLLGAAFILVFGLVLKETNPSGVEHLSHRLIIALILAILFIASFNKKGKVKKYFAGCVFISFTLTMCWVTWIVYMNNFTSNYVLGLLVAFCAISVVYHKPSLIVAHTAVSLAVTILFVSICHELETSSIAIYLALVVVAITSLTSILMRIRFEKQLALLNQNLEERVSDRTEELEINSAELIDKNSELEQIAKVVSHDLKTPLSSIMSLNKWLVDDYKGKFDEKGDQMLVLMKDKAEYLNELLEGIFAYRQIDEVKRYITEIDTNQLIQEIIAEKQLGDLADIKVRKLPKVNFNREYLYLIFDNLINNSIIHHQSKNNIIIDISSKEEEHFHKFRISDNGPGIESVYADRIFGLFETLKAKDDGKTAGIGLALSKRIISKADGEIYLGYEEEGATFYFTIKK